MEKNTRYLKQVIVVRKDLCMPTGKLGAMVAHAAMTFMIARKSHVTEDLFDKRRGAVQYTCALTPDEYRWLTELDPGLDGQVSMAKIVCECKDEASLVNIEQAAKLAGLECHRVVDCGYSHNKPGDLVCIAIGPDWPEKLNPVTGTLKLYR